MKAYVILHCYFPCLALTVPTFGNVIFMSSELSKTFNDRVLVSSRVIRSPVRSHSNEAIDRCNKVELCLISFPIKSLESNRRNQHAKNNITHH